MAKTVRRGFSRARGRQKQVTRAAGSKMLACNCGTEVKVDADVTTVTCGTCVQKIAAPPAMPKAPVSAEEKALRVERKLEKARQMEARRSGLIVAPSTKDLGFTRGWRFKKLFTTSLDEHGKSGKQRWFSVGKEITEAEYKKLQVRFANEAVETLTKPAPKVAVSNDEKHTLIDPNGNKHTLTVREFFKKHELWSGHVKKLIAGLKPSYKGWTVAK